jgi:hypothetical protein
VILHPPGHTWRAQMDVATPEEIRQQIVEAGVEVRRLRTEGVDELAAAALQRLLQLKTRYLELTGEEYRKKRTKEATLPGADEDGTSSRRPKQPRLAKEEAEEVPLDPLAEPPSGDTFPPWEPRTHFRFEVLHRSRKPGSRARVGRIHTPHGVIETPAFVPVGTNAALKALDERHSKEAGVQLTFCNTYHLLVHPGSDVVRRAGGLHSFMHHEGPLITDSGGFQVLSLQRHPLRLILARCPVPT